MVAEDKLQNYIQQHTASTIFVEHCAEEKAKDSLTFLGGWPLADECFEWPGDTGKRGNYAHLFLGQVRLKDLPFVPDEIKQEGVLYFFIDPIDLEDENVGNLEEALNLAKQSGDKKRIKLAEKKYAQQPRTVCVIHKSEPKNPVEVKPKASRLLSPDKNIFHHLYDKKNIKRAKEATYIKTSVVLLEGQVIPSPDESTSKDLPNHGDDVFCKLNKSFRFRAHSQEFGESATKIAFSEDGDQVEITSILTGISEDLHSFPFSGANLLYKKIDRSVGNSWPQSWEMVTEFVERTQHHFDDYLEIIKRGFRTVVTSRADGAHEIKEKFYNELEAIKNKGKLFGPTDIVSEQDRIQIRNNISKLFADNYIEWRKIDAEIRQKSKHTFISKLINRAESAKKLYDHFGYRLNLEYNFKIWAMVFGENMTVNEKISNRLTQFYGNDERSAINISITEALTDLVNETNPAVKKYILRQEKIGDLPKDAPRIEKRINANKEPHQMFGYGNDVQGKTRHRFKQGEIMLLQLEKDDEMEFGTADGNLQIWISSENARQGRWEFAEWNYDIT